jgi:hypothetical protein
MYRRVCLVHVLGLVLAGLAFTACAYRGPAVVDSERSIENGYELVVLRVTGGDGEGLTYSNHLRYKSRDLGQVGRYSVSPDGRFALYEQVGRLVLFDANDGTTSDVTDEPFRIPNVITWDLTAGLVKVTYFDESSVSRIPLPCRRSP